MDKRFANLFGLTEEKAIAVLNTPQDRLGEEDSRYIAASHLANFPTERAIAALIEAVRNTEPSLDNRIVRRKSMESLGRLQAKQALPAIRTGLADEDCYTVEVAAWAIGEIGTEDGEILEEMAQLLEKPGQIYRPIIHALAKLNYHPALARIRPLTASEDKPTASAAIATTYRFTGDNRAMGQVVDLLQHESVNARRSSIQDLIDAQYYSAIPQIARCPVSVIFRLRALRLMAEVGLKSGELSFAAIQPSLEQILRDRPQDIDLVHEYDNPPTLDFAIGELYQTDFGRCYLASQTLLEQYADEAPEALLATYAKEAHNDYGAHYHVMKLLGWLKYAPAYALLVEALHNPMPQFRKSRIAAAIALGELGEPRAIPELKASLDTKIWDLQYASLMALEQLGDVSGRDGAADDPDFLVRAKAQTLPNCQSVTPSPN